MKRFWRNVTPELRDRSVGMLYIIFVSTIWVVASFVVKDMEESVPDAILLTYISNALFIICFPIAILKNWITTICTRWGTTAFSMFALRCPWCDELVQP